MDVMNHIEDAFGELGMIMGSKEHSIVKIIVRGRLTTRMKKRMLGFISEANPRRSGLQVVGVPRENGHSSNKIIEN